MARSSVLRSLIVDLRTRSAKFEQGMDRSRRKLRMFGKEVKGVSSRVLNLKTALIGAAGSAGLLALTKQAIDTGDKIHKLSLRLGATTEALSQYQFVADSSGVTFETFTMGLQRMTRRVAEAAQGTGEARGALEELGLSAHELNQLRPEQTFERIADAMVGVESQSDKVRLAMKLFDSEGVSLIQTMDKGSAGIRELREEADRLGVTIDQSMADKMAAAKDATARLEAAFSGLGNMLAGEFADSIAKAVNFMADKLVPTLSAVARHIGIIEGDEKQKKRDRLFKIAMDLKSIAKQMEPLQRVEEASGKRLAPLTALMKRRNDLLEEQIRLRRELNEAEKKSREAKGTRLEVTKHGGGFNDPLTPDIGKVSERFQLMSVLDTEYTEGVMARRQAIKDQFLASEDAMTETHRAAAEERAAIEKVQNTTVRDMRRGAFQDAVGLLSALGAKSKTAAIAAIALNKGLRIAEVVQHTAAGVARANAEIPYPASLAVAAKIKAIGAAQIGLIAATGLVQAGNVGSGGAGGGAPGGEPIQTQADQPIAAENVRAQSQIVVQVRGRGGIQELVEEIRVATREHDLVVVDVDSRNGQDLRSQD